MENNSYHTILSTHEQVAEAVRVINQKINGCGYRFKEDTEGRYKSIAFANSYEGDHSLIVLASVDFAYYHSLELMFHQVIHTTIPPEASWPDHWQKDQIELVETLPDGTFVFCFNNTDNPVYRYTVTAKGFSYYFGSVANRW